MTPLDISVVVVSAGEGTRAFVRTVDCLQRQRVRPRRLLLACRAEGTTDVLRSTASRAGATLTDGATIPAALNAAVIDADAGGILVVPGGYRPGPDCLDVCSRRLAECPGIDVLVPAIRVESADGLRFRLREPTDLSLPALLAEPGLMPPVICFRRAAWSRLRGLDESAGVLALYDLVLRMLETGSTVATAETIAACDVTQCDEWPPRDIDRTAYLDLLRGVYSKHQPALEAVMTEVLVRRQILFGTLRDEHRGQVARRDAGLAELDRLRAETAHLRAWLSHHGIDALDWGDLRRSNPVSRNWGYDRGTPIDRHYIHEFLASHS
ncbi:MAG TPA: hypothetical protein VLD67_01675, partial [Vicinamibacterales bacterium]|nr:hypothetical protein [Vicinamibacterales bacterium]